MRIFIVHAHHEPQSFNGAMTATAVAALEGAGHEVRVSDLYAMGFNPVSDRSNFTTVLDDGYLKQVAEEAHAAANDGFAPELQAEMDKLFWCDALILQFPLWWFGMPAIMKGWVDRVFASGRVYGGDRWYDNGAFVGKRAMCSVTMAGRENLFAEDGLSGPIGQILFPINHGMLAFTGFTVVEPFLTHAPARMDAAARTAQLEAYRARVLSLSDAPTIAYPRLADYDETYRLRRAPGG